jgi:hypothetical protein
MLVFPPFLVIVLYKYIIKVHSYSIAVDEENKLHIYYTILWSLSVTISKTRQVKIWISVLSVSLFSPPRLGGGGRMCVTVRRPRVDGWGGGRVAVTATRLRNASLRWGGI